MNPFFTIITPTLNEEKFLPHLLTAIKRQKEKDFEIIIVDGGSSDKTNKIAKRFKSTFAAENISLKLIFSNKPNVSQQRNVGAKLATGQYLVFLDADIIIPPSYLFLIRKAIKKTGEPLLATWVEPDSEDLSNKAMTMLVNFLIEIGKEVGKPLLLGYDIIIKKSVFNSIGMFREDIKIGEDQELAERALKNGYKAHVLRNPTLIHSSRRYRKKGYIKTLYTYIIATLHVLFKGPITEGVVDYPMGGKAHE